MNRSFRDNLPYLSYQGMNQNRSLFYSTMSKKKIFEDFNILESSGKNCHIFYQKKRRFLKERGKCEFYICFIYVCCLGILKMIQGLTGVCKALIEYFCFRFANYFTLSALCENPILHKRSKTVKIIYWNLKTYQNGGFILATTVVQDFHPETSEK